MGGGGLSFLAKKYWHVTRPDNLERVWIAEKKKADEQKKALEREKQLREEQAQQTYLASLNTEDAERDRMKASLSFLYKAPPGLKELLEKEEKEKKEIERAKKQEEERKLDERIKRMAMLKNEGPEERATRRQFERKQEEMLSHAERESKRFDFLKDAPTMGEYTKNVKLKHKPLGILVREVRCVRCGVWGHLTGDRECKLRDVNPNDHSRQAREDPLAAMKKLEEGDQSSSTKKKKGKGKGRKYKDERSRSRSRGRGKKHHQSSSSSSRKHRHPRSWSRSVSRSRSPPPGVKRHFNSKRRYERRHERRYERRHERDSRSRSRSPVMKSSRHSQKNRKNEENKTKQDLIDERRARQHEDEQNEPAQFDPSARANQTDEDRNLKLIYPKGAGSLVRGGFDANDPNQQLLSEPEDEEPSSESDDEDLKYIQSLSLDEKMMLLKSMKKLQKAEKRRKRKKKEKKKRKKEKKRKRKEEGGGKSKKKPKR